MLLADDAALAKRLLVVDGVSGVFWPKRLKADVALFVSGCVRDPKGFEGCGVCSDDAVDGTPKTLLDG